MDDVSGAKQMSDLIKLVGGIKRAKEIMEGVSPWTTGYNIMSKTYFGGDIFSADQEFYIKDLLQAILDHDRTDNCSDIKNHLSPSTEVIER